MFSIFVYFWFFIQPLSSTKNLSQNFQVKLKTAHKHASPNRAANMMDDKHEEI